MSLAPARLSRIHQRTLNSPNHARWLLIVTLVGLFTTSFPVTILSISVSTIAKDLNSTPSTITWVTTAPILASAVATPILGRIGDLRGHRRLFVAGLVASGVFSILTALAWNAASVIAFRTLSQLGAAAIVPASFAMLFQAFPEAQRVRASALASGVTAGASVIGVVIGGPLIDWVGWRPIFVVQAAVALATVLPALLVLHVDVRRVLDTSIDYAGAVALTVATFTLTFGINRLGVWGITPVTAGCLIIAPLAGWALVRIEKRARSPLLPLNVLGAHNTRVVVGATVAINAGWMGSLIMTPLLMQNVMGLSAAATSLASVPRAGCIMLISPVAGRLGMRWGERRLVVGACILLGLVMLLMGVGAWSTSIVILVIALSLSGVALGNAQPALVSSMGHSVDAEDFGLAASLQQTANQLGGVVGIGLFTAIGADATTPGKFIVTYVIAAALSFGAAIISLALVDGFGRRRRRGEPRTRDLPRRHQIDAPSREAPSRDGEPCEAPAA